MSSRISVLRELDKPVVRIIENLARWREDVSVGTFPAKNPAHVDLSLRSLANVVTTARKSGDKPDPQMLANNMQDLLFAMLDGTSPHTILQSLIKQVQKRLIKEGSDWFYTPVSHRAFALIRMILNRIEGTPMSIGLDVSNTDTSYVCGRLFAVLCRIQRAAQGELNRDFASSSLRAVHGQSAGIPSPDLGAGRILPVEDPGGLSNMLAGELHAVTDLLGADGFPAEFTDEAAGQVSSRLSSSERRTCSGHTRAQRPPTRRQGSRRVMLSRTSCSGEKPGGFAIIVSGAAA